MSEELNDNEEQTSDIASEIIKRIEEARRTRATELDLSGLGITELPDSIGQLSALQVLCLSENQLTGLPESVRNLKSLEDLFLHGNDALNLPLEVLGPTVEEVRAKRAAGVEQEKIGQKSP